MYAALRKARGELFRADFGCIPDPVASQDPVRFLERIRRGIEIPGAGLPDDWVKAVENIHEGLSDARRVELALSAAAKRILAYLSDAAEAGLSLDEGLVSAEQVYERHRENLAASLVKVLDGWSLPDVYYIGYVCLQNLIQEAVSGMDAAPFPYQDLIDKYLADAGHCDGQR